MLSAYITDSTVSIEIQTSFSGIHINNLTEYGATTLSDTAKEESDK